MFKCWLYLALTIEYFAKSINKFASLKMLLLQETKFLLNTSGRPFLVMTLQKGEPNAQNVPGNFKKVSDLLSPYIHNLGAYKLHYHYTITIIEQRVVSFTMKKIIFGFTN